MLRILLLITMFCPFCAIAQDKLNAVQFDIMTSGKTYTYSKAGRAYGAEEYLPNHRVRWSFLDGQCMEGRWWEAGNQICFAYDDNPGDHHCWTFETAAGGLEAQFENDPTGLRSYKITSSNEPLFCLGPQVGV